MERVGDNLVRVKVMALPGQTCARCGWPGTGGWLEVYYALPENGPEKRVGGVYCCWSCFRNDTAEAPDSQGTEEVREVLRKGAELAQKMLKPFRDMLQGKEAGGVAIMAVILQSRADLEGKRKFWLAPLHVCREGTFELKSQYLRGTGAEADLDEEALLSVGALRIGEARAELSGGMDAGGAGAFSIDRRTVLPF